MCYHSFNVDSLFSFKIVILLVKFTNTSSDFYVLLDSVKQKESNCKLSEPKLSKQDFLYPPSGAVVLLLNCNDFINKLHKQIL